MRLTMRQPVSTIKMSMGEHGQMSIIRRSLTENWLGSPSELMNIPKPSSQVPLSAKYLRLDQFPDVMKIVRSNSQ